MKNSPVSALHRLAATTVHLNFICSEPVPRRRRLHHRRGEPHAAAGIQRLTGDPAQDTALDLPHDRHWVGDRDDGAAEADPGMTV